MINIATENLLSLSEAARVLPPVDGKRPHVSTIWRWCRKGLNGVTLEYCRLGRRIVTSPEALGRFTNALAAADRQHTARQRSNTSSSSGSSSPESRRD